MRRLLSAALVTGTLTLLGLAPASATPAAPTFSNLDVTTPGHVTGTVTSDQPYAWVRLATDVPAVKLTLAGGSAAFDLETWGFGDPTGASVQGVACPDDVPSNCSPVGYSTTFTPTDVTPDITWFTDGTIGPGQADPSLTVADTGGGDLWAIFVSDGDVSSVKLGHNATTVLPVTDGTGYVHVTRCATDNSYECNDAGFTAPQDHDLAVRRNSWALWASGLSTLADPNPTLGLSTSAVAGTTYSLSWHLEDPDNPGTPVTSAGATDVTGLLADATANVVIDTTGVPDGAYLVAGTITFDDPSFGTYTDVPAIAGYLTVDKTAPTVQSVHLTRTYVRPESGASDDLVTIDATGPDAAYSDTWTVRGPGGGIVRSALPSSVDPGTAWQAQFDGRDENGLPLPAGTYTVQLLDAAGNLGLSKTVQVQRLVPKTVTKTVTARASKVDQYVGRCSRLVSPSSHGWAGSLGYFANVRCRSTAGPDSYVATEHGFALPAAASYRDVQITTYGGAARRFGRSVANVFYEDPTRRKAVAASLLGSKVGSWAGPRKTASAMVTRFLGGHYVFWSVSAAARQHYDVKGFTVTVRYRVWH